MRRAVWLAAFQANARLFDQLSRQQSRLGRVIDRTQRELEALAGQVPAAAASQSGFAPSKRTLLSPTFTQPASAQSEMPRFTGPMADLKRKQWLRRQSHATATNMELNP